MIKKILSVIFIGILAFGITGCDVKFGSMKYEDYNIEYSGEIVNLSNKSKDKEISLDLKEDVKNINSIDIKMDSGSIEFKSGDVNAIEVIAKGNKESIKSDIKNGKLIIENREKKMSDISVETEITVTIPKNFNKDINVSIGVGVAIFKDISLNKLDLYNGVGLTVINKEVSSTEINISQGVGGIFVVMDKTNNINVSQEVGQILFYTKEINNKIDIESKIGDLKIGYLKGNNPKINSKIRLGKENKYIKQDGNVSEKGDIKARVNIGNVEIRTMSKEEFEEENFSNKIMNEILEE
ncbi:hypothetical protein [Clostridium thermobutyricum]|uniref:hypothetical protein n=1 Tax=Clostridium thermobutyricum TaxID=29372 RepID=UPI0018ABF0BF|nr:hypothetical protein [Clostridium thermobutyricum]